MTPAEHIAAAEELLATATSTDQLRVGPVDIGGLLAALTHVGIAIAVEVGVPHTAAPAGQAPNA